MGEASSVIGSSEVSLSVLNELLELSVVSVLFPSLFNGFKVDFKVSREGSESLLDDLEDFSDDGDFFNSGVVSVDELGDEFGAHLLGGALEGVVSSEFVVGRVDDLVFFDDALFHGGDLLLGSGDVLGESADGFLESVLEDVEGVDSGLFDFLVLGVVSLESSEEFIEGGLELGSETFVGVVGVVVGFEVVVIGGGESEENGDSLVQET